MSKTKDIEPLGKAVNYLFGSGRWILRECGKSWLAKKNDSGETTYPVGPSAAGVQADEIIKSSEDALRLPVNASKWNLARKNIRSLVGVLEVHVKRYTLADEKCAAHTKSAVSPRIVTFLEESGIIVTVAMWDLRNALDNLFGKKFFIPEIEAAEPKIPELKRKLERIRLGEELLRGGALSAPTARPVPKPNLPSHQLYVDWGDRVETITKRLMPSNNTDWIINLFGLPGMGKYALALELAHRCLEEQTFAAVIWITAGKEPMTIKDIRPACSRTLASYGEILDEIATLLGESRIVKQESIEKKRQSIKLILREKPCLLIITDVDRISNDKEILTFLRQCVQPTKCLLTSCHRLEGVDWCKESQPMPLKEALMLMRAECVNLDVMVGDEKLKELYETTGGNPLAMIWCIGEMRRVPVKRVLKTMMKIEGELLQYCFAQTQAELLPQVKRVLRLLSLFATSADYDALFVMSGAEDEDAFDEATGRLVDQSLAILEPGGRYRLLPLTREYVLSEMQKNDPAQTEQLSDGYIGYYKAFTANHQGKSEADLMILEFEHMNIRDALKWCTDLESVQKRRSLLGLVRALHSYQWLCGYWNELVEYNQLAFEACQRNSDWEHAGECAFRVGFTRFQQGNLDEADKWGHNALSAAGEAKNEYDLARFKRIPAMVARKRNEYQKSKQLLNEMLTASRALLNSVGDEEEKNKIKENVIADASTTMANLERDLGKNYSVARRLYEDALKLNCELGNQEKKGLNLNHLGWVDLAESLLKKDAGQQKEADCLLNLAEEHFREGRRYSEIVARTDQILTGAYGLARVAEERGEYERAELLVQEVLEKHGHSYAAEVKEIKELLSRIE